MPSQPRRTDGPATRQARVGEAARLAAQAHPEWGDDLEIIVVVARRREPGGPPQTPDNADGLVLSGFREDGVNQAARLCASAAKGIYAAAGVPCVVDVRPIPRG